MQFTWNPELSAAIHSCRHIGQGIVEVVHDVSHEVGLVGAINAGYSTGIDHPPKGENPNAHPINENDQK